jgi:hypothetical protein
MIGEETAIVLVNGALVRTMLIRLRHTATTPSLEQKLGLCRVFIDARPGRARPRAPTDLADLPPSRRRQRRSWFAGENVGANSLETDGKSRPRCCPVEKRTSIFCSVSTESRDLRCHAIIPASAHRAPHNRYSDDLAVKRRADAENVPNDALMVPMVCGHESICFRQFEPLNRKPRHQHLAPVCENRISIVRTIV